MFSVPNSFVMLQSCQIATNPNTIVTLRRVIAVMRSVGMVWPTTLHARQSKLRPGSAGGDTSTYLLRRYCSSPQVFRVVYEKKSRWEYG
jgi:hypothetical protein